MGYFVEFVEEPDGFGGCLGCLFALGLLSFFFGGSVALGATKFHKKNHK